MRIEQQIFYFYLIQKMKQEKEGKLFNVEKERIKDGEKNGEGVKINLEQV